MGLITGTLRVIHPVRTMKRSVKRAVVPRSIRRAESQMLSVAHPVSHAKYQAIGALDRAATPKRRPRKAQTKPARAGRSAQQGKKNWNVIIPVWCVIYPLFMFLFGPGFGLAGVGISAVVLTIFLLYHIGRRQQERQAAHADAERHGPEGSR